MNRKDCESMELIPRKVYLDDIFDEFVSSKREQGMKCDIYERDGSYYVEMDFPGFKKEDISVETNEGYIIIKALKNRECDEDNDKKYVRRERIYSKFERSFYLGDFDSEKIEASFENGVLNVVVPKKEVIDNKRRIEIR